MLIYKFVRIMKTPLQHSYYVVVFSCCSHPLLVIYLPIYLQLFHVRTRCYLHRCLHRFRQIIQQFYFYHQTYYLCHRAMRNCWCIINLHVFIVSYPYPIKTDHSQLLQRQRILRIINMPNQLEYFKFIKRILNRIIILKLMSEFHIMFRHLISLI